MTSNLDLVRAAYEGTSEENGRNLLAVLSPEVIWTEAEGFPYAGTYVGPAAIIEGVFNRLATEWIDYRANVHTFMHDGDRVAAFGNYSGIFTLTKKPFSASFAHLYELHGGKIVQMTQYVDSAMVRLAMQ